MFVTATDRRPTTLGAGLGALVIGVHVLAAMPAHGQPRLDAAGVQACTSVAQLISELQIRTVPTAQARHRLMVIYDIARPSSTPSLRQTASVHIGQIATADDTLLLGMAEQFRAACR